VLLFIAEILPETHQDKVERRFERLKGRLTSFLMVERRRGDQDMKRRRRCRNN